MILESRWSCDHEFESQHPYLFNKNKTQNSMSLCKFQVQRLFTLEDVLKNNIWYLETDTIFIIYI
jgi:hypothetical protein